MLLIGVLLTLLFLGLVIVLQLRGALGAQAGRQLGAMILLLTAGVWSALEVTHRNEPPPPEDQTSSRPVQSQACSKCHASHYASWQRTYHRTMTREATPEYVKADFNDAVHHYQGVTSRMYRRGDQFFVETIDPLWAAEMARDGIPLDGVGTAPRKELSVDRLVGSHWFQQLMHLDEQGRYVRLPLVYHLVEKKWVHVNGVFLIPNRDFFGMASIWNETCLYCHNTRPVKNPQPVPDQSLGYSTEVGELGISCEACHGAGERHVLAHQNPARRLAQHYSDEPDPTIVNPAKLSVIRADDICARCHGSTLPHFKEWDRRTDADPFLAGRDLKRFWRVPFSETEIKLLLAGADPVVAREARRDPHDGRFWGDGTPLTTAVEYQGMALSACYENGQGKMSCLSCHSMHHADPNHQVKEGMRTNEACYQCHENYRTKLAQHTHHAAESQGSNCMNCHMPHQVYSLLDTHRSHRISIPRVKDSLGTGKPHACNLCHLDKSLGWTQEHLVHWYKTAPVPLSQDDRTIASSVLHLAQGDGRTRALVAGVFAWKPAHEASGRDWPVMVLTRTLEHERYEAVRYSAHKALRSLHGKAADDYNYQGSAPERAAQLRALRETLESGVTLDPSRYPYLPLTPAGAFSDAVFDRLRTTRNDLDVEIRE